MRAPKVRSNSAKPNICVGVFMGPWEKYPRNAATDVETPVMVWTLDGSSCT
jgi:hypothetical protein